MLFVLVLAVSLLAIAFGRLPKVGATVVSVAPNPVCTTNPVVTSNLDDGPGSLRQAVADACLGSTITFNVPLLRIPLSSGQITIDKNLTIQGPGANLLNVQNVAPASPTNRVFKVNKGVTATINGLTVSGGNVIDANGGGILNQGNLTITGSVIRDNRADDSNPVVDIRVYGGGIYNSENAVLTVTYSTISNNYVRGGGGAFQTEAAISTKCPRQSAALPKTSAAQ